MVLGVKPMDSLATNVGIDVSKDFLDVSFELGKAWRVSNNAQGHEELLVGLPAGSCIHLEASGGYERLVRRKLQAAGFNVKTHDPLKVRRYAQSQARHAKTDAQDAHHLARHGEAIPTHQGKTQEHESLADLSRAIAELKASASQMKVRLKANWLSQAVVEAYSAAAAAVEAQAKKLEKEFVRRVRGSAMQERYRLAQTVPGAGPCLARVLTSELPENLELYTIPQLCSYGGVAPRDNESGKSKRPARIGRGNSRIKGALYMPALACIQRQIWAKDLYARLRAKGKSHQQAVVAVMRRLLVRVLAVLKRGSPWNDEALTT